MMKTKSDLINDAPLLDVSKYSEHKKVLGAVSFFVDEVIKPPQRERKTHWKNIRMLVTSLWLASKASNNPWRSLSRDKNAYLDETRNDSIYITFSLVAAVDRLIELGYIEQINGKYNHKTKQGRTARIRATDKLLDLIKVRDIYSVPAVNPDLTKDTIFLKDEEKRVVSSFPENGRTAEIRAAMLLLNKLYASTRIEVSRKALDSDRFVDITDTWVFRSMNNGNWWDGGRICGGLWQTVEREYRKTITIEGEAVTELDYKANHPSMMYLLFTGEPVPEDCYAIPGYERDLLKLTMMRMINNSSREAAIRSTILGINEENEKRNKRGKKELEILTRNQVEQIVDELEQFHSPIRNGFYDKDICYTLQNLEGEIGVDITLTLMKAGIVCLPVHDSFIVQTKHRETLHNQMKDSYFKYLNSYPTIDTKY